MIDNVIDFQQWKNDYRPIDPFAEIDADEALALWSECQRGQIRVRVKVDDPQERRAARSVDHDVFRV